MSLVVAIGKGVQPRTEYIERQYRDDPRETGEGCL